MFTCTKAHSSSRSAIYHSFVSVSVTYGGDISGVADVTTVTWDWKHFAITCQRKFDCLLWKRIVIKKTIREKYLISLLKISLRKSFGHEKIGNVQNSNCNLCDILISQFSTFFTCTPCAAVFSPEEKEIKIFYSIQINITIKYYTIANIRYFLLIATNFDFI